MQQTSTPQASMTQTSMAQPNTNRAVGRRKLARLSPLAAVVIAAVLTGCGSGSDGSSAVTTTIAAQAVNTSSANSNSSVSTGATAAANTANISAANTSAANNSGGPGGFGKNVDALSITTVDQLNALINEAYGEASLGLHRGHQPVEQVLIDTLGISHDEMHVRMDAGQNLSAIADELGVGTDTLINALVDNWQPAIDQLESEGLIAADQATAYHQALVDAFTFKVTWNGSDQAPTFSGV